MSRGKTHVCSSNHELHEFLSPKFVQFVQFVVAGLHYPQWPSDGPPATAKIAPSGSDRAETVDKEKGGKPPKIRESAVHSKPSALIRLTPFEKELDEFRDPTAEAVHVLLPRS